MAQSQRIPPEHGSPLAKALSGAELVIFDFDGVIADSEVLSLGTLRDTLADCGMPMSLARVRELFLGTSLATITEHIALHGPNGAAEGFAERWQNALFGQLRSDLTPVNAILPFLEALQSLGVHHCIASSSNFERIGLSLTTMRLTEHFPHLFSAQQVKNGKPAPDLFLYAAQQMETAPDACLVIEDSPHGVQAARAAGMRVFGFVDGGHLTDIRSAHAEVLLNAGAARVLNGFAELLAAPTYSGHSGRPEQQTGE
ncbi:MAG: HAD family phosphatase [Pseudomonadota bacterium]